MRPFTLSEQTLFADLIQRCLDAGFDEQFPENGSFTQLTRNDRAYWYYQGYELDPAGQASGRRYSKYVGPVDDPQISERVERFRALKSDHQERRRLVSLLKRAGAPSPTRLGGDVVETLWKAGLFRLRGVLVGTVAFQTYGGLLGVRMPDAQIMTLDVDFAQFHSISASVEDSIPPIMDSLKAIDPSYRAIPHVSDPRASTAFTNSAGFRVEFLTPNESSDDYQDRPALMPALGGASAQPLRYLAFLIRDPVWSVLLHKAGVPVLVPRPERYAVHKLIIGRLRKASATSRAKAAKDLRQAEVLIEALERSGAADDLGRAWIEAWDNGPKWRENLSDAAGAVAPGTRDRLWSAVEVAVAGTDRSIAEFDLKAAGG